VVVEVAQLVSPSPQSMAAAAAAHRRPPPPTGVAYPSGDLAAAGTTFGDWKSLDGRAEQIDLPLLLALLLSRQLNRGFDDVKSGEK